MKRIIQWTIAIHLITGGFLPALVAGLAYVEFDMIRAALADIQDTIDKIDRIARLFSPWI